MDATVTESVEIVSAKDAVQPTVLSELDVELLDKVGGGWLSWGY
jgi:hypothetical protein